MAHGASTEAEIRAVASELAGASPDGETGVYHLSWWTERVLDWAMAHPEFKTQLFRMVDVFPACRDQHDVVRHLDEYFEGVDVPAAVRTGLGVAERVPLGPRLAASVTRRNIERMARQFIAGDDPSAAVEQLAALWESGEAFTVDLLGEKTVTEAEADRYASRVADLLTVLEASTRDWPERPHLERDPWGPLPRVNVSVKATALAPLFAPLTRDAGLEQAEERLVPVLEQARRMGATVYLDMEHYGVKDLTHELLRRLGERFSDGPHLGAVVQAYLRDSYDDLAALVEWAGETLATPLQVRLVKGAYWDFEVVEARSHEWPEPVFTGKAQTDANFERCVDLLLDHAGTVRPAVGSHNLRSLAYAIVGARRRGLDPAALELQLLYGMAEPVHAALVAEGRRVRAYAPVGALVPGMAYLVRRLLENTANESFVRMRFAEGVDVDALVAAPDAAADRLPGPAPEAAVDPTDPTAPEPFQLEPHAEFRRRRARDRMSAAVDAAGRGFGFDAPVVVDGRERGVEADRCIVSVDPGDTATTVCRSGRATTADADEAVEVARQAVGEWAARPASERAAVLFRAAELLRRRRAELAALEVFEAGKPWAEADADVTEAIDFLEYYGRQARALGAGKPIIQVPGETNEYRYEPRGVVAVVTPWNFPLAIPTGMVAAPLVTGNAVMFKPAEQTPGVAWRLFETLREAGVPPGVLAFLPGVGEEVGAHLVTHPDVSVVSFTGSRAVGLSIVAEAAVHRPGQRHVKRVVAEMGGKNAVVVDDDADLDVAVPGVVASAFGYAGQKCSACSRVVVLDAVFDEFVERLVGASRMVPVGHARHMGTVVGPVIDADAHERLGRYRSLAAEEGEVVLARDDVPGGGWYAGPTVVVAGAGCRVATEEIFGPLLTVVRAGDFDEALAIADASDYGLTGGIFSRSPSRIRRAARELQVGNFYVNRTITGSLVGRQPFGGLRLSGVGSKAGGPDYLLQFVEPRVVTENTVRQGFAPLPDA